MKNYNLFLTALFFLIFSNTVYAQQNTPADFKINVNPAVNEGSPSFKIQPLRDHRYHVIFHEVQGKNLTLLTSSTLQSTGTVQVELPTVEKNTYIRTTVTTDAQTLEPLWEWATLAVPKGKKLIDYHGKKELLPPADFDAYWDKAKSELSAVPFTPEILRVPDRDTSTGLLFQINLPSVEETTISCWYMVPKAAFEDQDPSKNVIKKFPAVIISPGYGAEQPPMDRTADGFITFSVNPRNHGPSRAYWKSPVEHIIYNIENPDKYYYKLAILDCLRSARFVFNRPEVDSDRVAAEGGSQGGLLTIGLASLEPRLKCAVANVVAFSDYPDGVNLSLRGGSHKMLEYLTDETTRTTVSKTLSYVDGANLVTRLKVPLQINMGGQDPVCSYITGIVVYNRVKDGTPKQYNISPDAKHEVNQEMRTWNREWYAKWLKK